MTETEPSQQWASANCSGGNHQLPDVGLICRNYDHITLDGATRGSRRPRLRLVLLTTLLMVSILGSVTLFRATGMTWPVYLLAALGVVNLFAIVTSRGASLPIAVYQLVLVTAAWALWEPAMSTFPALASAADDWWVTVTIALLLASTGLAFVVGRLTALPDLKSISSWYLAVATFVLGLWGMWGLLVEAGEVPGWAYQVVLGAVILAPLAILFVILGREHPLEDSRANSAAVWFVLIAVYLTSIEYLAKVSELLFGRFLPGLLGAAPVDVVQLPAWFEILRWKSLITTVLAVGAISFIGAASVIDTASEFRATKRNYYHRKLEQLTAGLRPGTGDVALRSQISALGFAAMLNMIYDFTSKTAATFARSLIAIIRRSAYYLLKLLRYLSPVIAFSVLGLLVILALEDYAAYRGAPTGGTLIPTELWGEFITVMISAVGLSVLSFGSARAP